MTTRTVKMLGLAYGSTPAEITITFDGSSVYTGTIPTVDGPLPALPNLALVDTTVEFCNFEIPMDLEGTKPMTCEVTNGTVIFAQILANYCAIANTIPVFGYGPDVFVCTDGTFGTGDARSNVLIDGVAQTINNTEEFIGPWWFTVPAGSTLTYDLDIVAGSTNTYVPPEEPTTP